MCFRMTDLVSDTKRCFVQSRAPVALTRRLAQRGCSSLQANPRTRQRFVAPHRRFPSVQPRCRALRRVAPDSPARFDRCQRRVQQGNIVPPSRRDREVRPVGGRADSRPVPRPRPHSAHPAEPPRWKNPAHRDRRGRLPATPRSVQNSVNPGEATRCVAHPRRRHRRRHEIHTGAQAGGDIAASRLNRPRLLQTRHGHAGVGAPHRWPSAGRRAATAAAAGLRMGNLALR